MEDRIITYGGQAVLEGVLMRGRKAMAIAIVKRSFLLIFMAVLHP